MAKMNLSLSAKIKRGTNIKDVRVPAALERSVPLAPERSKVAFLNSVFGGEGATPSSVTMFTGVPGAGKSTLMIQAADAITGLGHVVIYNGNEEAATQMKKTYRRLGLKNGYLVGNEVMVEDLLEYVREVCDEVVGQKAKDGSPVQVFCIVDSLQTMDDGKYAKRDKEGNVTQSGHTNGNTPLRATEMICEAAKTPHGVEDPRSKDAIYPIFILIGHVTKSGDFAGKQAIVHTIDAKMHLWIDTDPKSDTCGKRCIQMGKNRFGGGDDLHILNMTGKGLVEANDFPNLFN